MTACCGFRVRSSEFRTFAVALALAGPTRSLAQAPARVVGPVDFYGVEHVSREALMVALRISPGDTLPGSPAAEAQVTRRVAAVPGIRRARLAPVCCDGDRWILFVGVEEKISEPVTFRAPPTGRSRVADTLRALSEAFEEQLFEALKAGRAGDDLSEGHSLMEFPPARAIQEWVLEYAAGHQAALSVVVRESADSDSRAIAAWALGYAPDKQRAIPDLVAAARDPYPEVRNNAVRALVAIGTLAGLKPELGLQVPTESLVILLHSPVWTDRNKAGYALMALTQTRDPALLADLRQRALGPLVEMARWQSQGHALAPYLVVARMVGVSDSAAFVAFERGERESIIRHVLH